MSGRSLELQRLGRAIEALQKAVRAGDALQMAALAPPIEDLCRRLDGADLSGPGQIAQAEALRRKARALHRETGAALAALRRAQEILSGLGGQAEARTYGPGGEWVSLAPTGRRLEHRS